MTSLNPLRIIKQRIKSAFNRAYFVKKLRDSDAILEEIYKQEIEGEGKISPQVQKLAWKTLIRDLLTNRLEQLNVFDAEDKQPDLFRDLDYQFTFREHGNPVQCVLGDIDYQRGVALLKRKEANLTAAHHARDDYVRVWSLVGPLLQANEGWVWRDAVSHLEENGGIPDHDEDAA